MFYIARLAAALLLSGVSFCQIASSPSDSKITHSEALATMEYPAGSVSLLNSFDQAPAGISNIRRGPFGEDFDIKPSALLLSRPRSFGFHWKRALLESFTFLAIEQAYVVKDDFRWVVIENGVPFNHYWRDYKQSLSTWVHSGWDDGDPVLYSYVGHPIQGAVAGYIQIQNDPQGENLEFSNTKAYWWSRFKALLWNAAYSAQWNIGPLSELTVEKYGTTARQPWNQNGTWPCTKKPCVTGVGQVDLVITPVGGFAWILTEDLLDKQIARRVEGATRNRQLIDVVRCVLNPMRGGANILHGKRPWYRASRNSGQMYFSIDLKSTKFPDTAPDP
jgi:hypothetical protein